MEGSPLVSVIIPMYNSEIYIVDTINSVLAQSYINFEILVIDDCSTDRSFDIVLDMTRNDSRIRLYKLSENFGGPARPRNLGVSKSNGKYIAFLDSDDLWAANKLEIQLNVMLNGKFNFTSTSQRNIDSSGKYISRNLFLGRIKGLFISRNSLPDLIIGKHIALSSVLVSKDALKFDFDESSQLIAVEDYFLWMNILNEQDVNYHFIDMELLDYRVLAGSISHRGKKYNHEAKSLFATLKFILLSERYDLYPYVLKSIFFGLIVSLKNRL